MSQVREPRVSRHLRGVEPEELLEKGAAVRQMLDHPGWVVVRELVELEERAAMQELVADSAAGKEAAEYAKALGEIQGIAIARAVVEVVLAKAEAAEAELKRIAAEAA